MSDRENVMGEAEKEAQGQPVEAREHGNNSDTVRRHRRGDAGVEGDIEGSTQGRTTTGRRDTANRGETGGREQSGARREAGGAGEDGGGGHGRSMERSDKILISTPAALGMVALAVIFVLSLLRVPEWLQFVMALVLFVALGLGAYRYVITPSGRREEGGSD
jgi:hypothetical protein